MTEAGEIVVERDLMVSAGDGVLLATDVCWPEGPPVSGTLGAHAVRQIGGERSERNAASETYASCAPPRARQRSPRCTRRR
jgi:hypothetical protein